MRRLSSSQFVVIVVAVCVAAVFAPVGVMAATGSFVNITDPSTSSYKARVTSKGALAVTTRDSVTGYQARVDSTGHLLVGDGSGAMTVNGTVGVAGTVPVTGTVNTRATTAVTPYEADEGIGNGAIVTAAHPAGVLYGGTGHLAMSALMVTAAGGDNNGEDDILIIAYVARGVASADCTTLTGGSFAAGERFTVAVQPGHTEQLTYPVPVAWSTYATAGDYTCIRAELRSHGSLAAATLRLTGFLT